MPAPSPVIGGDERVSEVRPDLLREDLALKKVACVTEQDSHESLVRLMFRSEIDEIPVVDARRAVIGKIGMLELLAAWHAG